MASNLDRRTRILEALPTRAATVSTEDAHRHMLEVAAARGLTEADVEARFGGTPGFAVALLLERASSAHADAEWDARVTKHGGDAIAAIFEMLKQPG